MMHNLKRLIIIAMFFGMLPAQGLRDPFSFETSTLEKNISSEKKELAVGDTINACKIVSISGCELVLQNQEGQLHKICLPREISAEN